MPSPTIFYPGVNPVHRDMPAVGSDSALLRGNNLSDLISVPEALANLGLSDDYFAAIVTGLTLTKSLNLSDVPDAPTARTNLGINAALIGTLYASWFSGLAGSPSGSPGWWNNGGIPTYS